MNGIVYLGYLTFYKFKNVILLGYKVKGAEKFNKQKTQGLLKLR